MSESLLGHRVSRNGTRHGDVSYVTLALPDAAAGRRFYGRVLGWNFGTGALESEGNQADRVVPQVGLWPGDAWHEGVTPGAILSWRVDDVETAVARVRGAGGSANDPEQLPYGLQSECTDGQGLRCWLHELPPPGEPAGPNGDREGDISLWCCGSVTSDGLAPSSRTCSVGPSRPATSGSTSRSPRP